MQNYTEISENQGLLESLPLILNNDKTAISCSSGTVFPTTNLQVGQLCFRTDLGKLYQNGGSVLGWVEIADLNKSFPQHLSGAVVAESGQSVKLKTARTINGTSFDGTANITTANWGAARTVAVGRTGKSVNGSANVAWTLDEILPTATNGQILKHNGTSWVVSTDANTTYSAMSQTEAETGTAATARVITAVVLKKAVEKHAPFGGQYLGTQATRAISYNAQAITENVTIPGNVNALSAGPITINTGFTVTISDGATWTVV